MANRVTKKEFDKIKNESYTVIYFEDKSSERDLMAGGFDFLSVFKEVQRKDKIPIFVSKEQAEAVHRLELSMGHFARVTYGQVMKIKRLMKNG